jgi:hypothetical protein
MTSSKPDAGPNPVLVPPNFMADYLGIIQRCLKRGGFTNWSGFHSYGRNVMELTLARGYIKKLLDNAKVVKFLAQRKPDLLGSLQEVVEAASLEA